MLELFAKDMRITKIGHSCLLIEEGSVRILMDPGNYSPVPQAEGVDVVLITHEHDDHCYLPAIQEVIEKNPAAEVITHAAVGKKLEAVGLKWTAIADGEVLERKGVKIASYGTTHARIHQDIPIIANTGFLIADRLFYPGDSFHQPPVEVEILALPVAAPWMRIEECIEYAKAVKPKVAFPVHDGMLRPEARGSSKILPEKLLAPAHIQFVDAMEDTTLEW